MHTPLPYVGTTTPLPATLPATVKEATRETAAIRWWEPFAVFAATFLALSLFVPRIISYLNPVTGDEPFYLMTAISLWQDGDLNECNNYRQRDEALIYPDFYRPGAAFPPGWVGWTRVPYPLPPHTAHIIPESRLCVSTDPSVPLPADGTGNELYSKHGLGLTLLALPAFVLGGRELVVYFLVALGALLAANVYLLARESTHRLWPAILTWAAFGFTVPQLPYSYLIFPELPAALLVLYAFRRIRLWNNNWLQVAAVGACIAFLPWLHYRFVPVSAALFAYYIYVSVRRRTTHRTANYAVVISQSVVSAVLLMAYFYQRYRQITPNFEDHAGISDGAGTLRGAAGLYLDVQWGLLVASPVFILAAVGVALMLADRRRRGDLLWLGVVFLPYFGVIANYAQWWGEWCPPARYLTSVLPLLALPFAVSLDRIRVIPYKIIYGGLMALSMLSVWGYLYQPQWMYNQPDGSSRLILYGLPMFLEKLPGNLLAMINPIAANAWFPSFVLPYFGYTQLGQEAGDALAAQAWQVSVGPVIFFAVVTLLGLALAGWTTLRREHAGPLPVDEAWEIDRLPRRPRRSMRPQTASAGVTYAGYTAHSSSEPQERFVPYMGPTAPGRAPYLPGSPGQEFPPEETVVRPALPPLLLALWRSRVALAGATALLLALAGEQLMRVASAGDPSAAASNAEVGTHMVQLAALFVGLVAWVNNGFKFGRRRIALEAPTASVAPQQTLLVRPRRSAGAVAGQGYSPSRYAMRYTEWRARIGGRGTLVGLLVTGGLAALLVLLLAGDFSNPLAPWVWLLMMVALVLTFLGVRPWPQAPTLLTHDPDEPAVEPPVSRREWLIIGAIMAAAIFLRLWQLDSIPIGPYIDESGRALDAIAINQGKPLVEGPYYFFGAGWWGVPSLYFWLEAQSMKLFGDNLLGARTIHALAGIATVWFIYRTGRAIWSPRAGLIAAALTAGSDLAIQFSRTAGESTITLFTWTACLYYLYRALKLRRPLDFVLSGLAGGFTLYGYASGKLLPVFLALVAVYLLVRWRWQGVKRYLPGFALLALTAGLVFLPNGQYLLTRDPEALTARSKGVSIFSEANHRALVENNGTDNWGVILAHQTTLTYGAFDVGREQGPFYPTNQPVLPVPWAALWVLGTAYMLWRIWDARYGVLALWLLGGLAGAILTNDTPTLQRVVGMVPLLGLIPALFLDRVASGLAPSSLSLLSLRPRRTRLLRWATNLGIAALVTALTTATVSYYFGPYTAEAHYLWPTFPGRYAAKLDPKHNVIYEAEIPWFNGDPSPNFFLSRDLPIDGLSNLSSRLPLLTEEGWNVHFLIAPSAGQYIPILQTFYPQGTLGAINNPDGSVAFTSYRIDAAEINSLREVKALYRAQGQPPVERLEPRLGTLGLGDIEATAPPASLSYPATAEWSGGLVAPAYGTYTIDLAAPAGASLEIDGRQLVNVEVGTPSVEAQVVLAQGPHKVRLQGLLESAEDQIALQWGADAGSLRPVAPQFLWNGPQGAMLRETYPVAPSSDWFSQPQPPLDGVPTLAAARDGVLSWRDLNDLPGGSGAFRRWRGVLMIPRDGEYTFSIGGSGQAGVWVDGKLAGAQEVGDNLPPMPAKVTLAEGEHPFEVRFGATGGSARFELLWQPPGAEPALLPPTALLPAEGGAWSPGERPDVPPPDGSLLNKADNMQATVVGTIEGSGLWKNPVALAASPDGGVVVGDGANKRVYIYDAGRRRVAVSDGKGATDPAELSDLSGLAVAPDGTIAALDAQSGDIRLLDRGGQLLAHLPYAQLRLTSPRGITWGPDGKMYVADTGGSRVVRISRDGQVEAEFTQVIGGIEPIEQPVDVAVTAKGTLYAIDLRRRIVRFNSDGLIDRTWTVPMGVTNGGSHIAIWGDRIAVTNPDSNIVTVVDLKTGAVSALTGKDDAPLNLSGTTGIDAGEDGLLYIMDAGNRRVVILDKAP